MIITVSGEPGAGSTTISRLLAKRLGYRLVTIGELFKELAKEHGMTAENLMEKLQQQPELSQEFHEKVDQKQKELANDENIIFNGKLSAFHIPNADLKIFLTASLETRVSFTLIRDRGEAGETRRSITNREKIEREEWKRIYGFDYIADREAYDMIIETGDLNPEEIVENILKLMEE